jgi:hypothetical protein
VRYPTLPCDRLEKLSAARDSACFAVPEWERGLIAPDPVPGSRSVEPNSSDGGQGGMAAAADFRLFLPEHESR